MLLDYLEKVAVPVILALIASGTFGAFKLSRRKDGPVTPIPPTLASPTSAPLPPPSLPEPEDEDEVEAWLYNEVRRLVVADANKSARLAEVESRLSGLASDFDTVRDATVPLVRWLDANPNKTAPVVSTAARRLLGLLTHDHDPAEGTT